MKFRLNEFKKIAAWLDKHLPHPIAYLLKGYLWGLEEHWIDAKVSSSVEKAISDYRASEAPLVTPPEYYEEESEVEGLPILEIRSGFTRTRQQNKE